jgi:hypothetical protein
MQGVANSYKHSSTLVFCIDAGGEVTEKQIFGTIYAHTDVIDELSLSNLQKTGRAGKCILERNGNGWTLRIPCSLSLPEAALLTAAIECIDNVAGHPARFKLLNLMTRETILTKLAKRAQQIANSLAD